MKNEIRKKMTKRRESLSQKQVESKSGAIHKNLFEMPAWNESAHMMVYLDFRNEVTTIPLIKTYLRKGKKVYIPVTNPGDYSLTVSELINPVEDLEIGHFGLKEPRKETLRPANPCLLDLVIVPGVAFDGQGYRIGLGAGYYDRFLPTLPQNTCLISMAYQFQLINRVPRESHDIPVQWIVTESQVIHCIENRR